MDKLLNQVESLAGSNAGILGLIVGGLVVFWIAKKMIKMVIGITLLAGLIYYLTSQ